MPLTPDGMLYTGTEVKRTLQNDNLTEADWNQPSRRVRSHDEMVTAAETKRKFQQCRKTIQIGETIFRCDRKHGLLSDPKSDFTHHEEGLMKVTGQPDVKYEITWFETPQPWTIRTK